MFYYYFYLLSGHQSPAAAHS